mmetsp:Transcript_27943/g.79667  ORF Transcript_27943/g.79667 Transcript_27943/m.79667 type:complete len:378 (-) Transcript_27943:91-1224(-)
MVAAENLERQVPAVALRDVVAAGAVRHGEAQIRELVLARQPDEYVVGLDVQVCEALAVQHRQPRRSLLQNGRQLQLLEPRLERRVPLIDSVPQRAAAELRLEVDAVVLHPTGVVADDVPRASSRPCGQGGQGAGLPQRRGGNGAAGVLALLDLDRVELLVQSAPSPVHGGEVAPADEFDLAELAQEAALVGVAGAAELAQDGIFVRVAADSGCRRRGQSRGLAGTLRRGGHALRLQLPRGGLRSAGWAAGAALLLRRRRPENSWRWRRTPSLGQLGACLARGLRIRLPTGLPDEDVRPDPRAGEGLHHRLWSGRLRWRRPRHQVATPQHTWRTRSMHLRLQLERRREPSAWSPRTREQVLRVLWRFRRRQVAPGSSG